nr:amidohydrolase family protein [Halomonas tianxiuensis]
MPAAGNRQCLGQAIRCLSHHRWPIPPYEDVLPFARQLLSANEERCVWGSDWPHPHIPVAMPNDGDLLSELARWAPDERLRQRILVDNPECLYFS